MKTQAHTGLTTHTALERLALDGPNTITEGTKTRWWQMLARQFGDVMIWLLLGAAALSALSGEVTDAAVIGAIVFMNAGIGFFQEFRTEKTLDALRSMLSPQVRVLRDGTWQAIDSTQLVAGDLVQLGEGDKVPADGVLVTANNLKIEESALTGESVPVEKHLQNEVHMGTSVARGSGLLRIENTGMTTQFGQIAALATSTKATLSPLQKELHTIGRFVLWITLGLSVLLLIAGVLRGQTLLEAVLYSISVAIAAVPEGLPTTITVALALGAGILARRHAIVKRLSSVETLGAVSIICTDKTGTLTKNQMTVREVYLADRSQWSVTGVGYDPAFGAIVYDGGSDQNTQNDALLDQLLRVCDTCSEAQLSHVDGTWGVLGDPTEGALLTLSQKGNTPEKAAEKLYPFDSDRKRMSVYADGHVLAKGAPEQLLAVCTHWSDGTTAHALTDAKRAQILEHYTRMAQKALRVLACAVRPVGVAPTDENEAEQDLTFVGLVGMIDPPRADVADAVSACHGGGIRVVVITGDSPTTAEAIARELGIIKSNNPRILTGNQVEQLSDEELSLFLQSEVLFARALPAQKMRIVELLQQQKNVVAMTGDGVNDAPALKRADIGVAMGITGTEVSKESATMVLTDDSFSTIVTAVAEGRRIYANLRKCIWFLFTCNVGELVTVLSAIIFGFSAPLTAVLILAIDLGTDILPAIALGVDTPEKGLMNRPPRAYDARILNRPFIADFLVSGLLIGVCSTLAFLVTLKTTNSVPLAQTVAFASLVVVQLVNAFSARSFTQSVLTMNPLSNSFLVISVLASVLLLVVMVYVPSFNTWLGTVPLGAAQWQLVAAAVLVPAVGIELKKAIMRANRAL